MNEKIETKHCHQCNTTKPFKEFNKGRGKHGLRSQCIKCSSSNSKKWGLRKKLQLGINPLEFKVFKIANVLHKKCRCCKEIKSIDNFYKKYYKNEIRYDSFCLICYRERQKEFVKQTEILNPGYISEQQKLHRANNRERVLWNNARYRARKFNVPFLIKVSDIKIPEFCPVLGIRLEYGNGGSTDFSPALDRIIPKLGYVIGNIMVISHRANTIKNNGTIDEHLKIIDYMKKHGGE